jgi:hypothetical protein
MIALSSMCFLRSFKLSKLIMISNSQSAVHEPVIDYETGEIKHESHHFKPLSKTIIQYLDYPESKFNGEIGILGREHVYADGVIYIGKEANNINEQALDVDKVQLFVNKRDIMDKILQFTSEIARKVSIAYRGTLKRLQDRIKQTGDINLNVKFMRELADELM